MAEQGSVGGLDRRRLPVDVLVRSARISMTTKSVWAGGAVLLAIGLAVTGRIPRSKAALAGVVIWLLGAVFPVLGALRNQA